VTLSEQLTSAGFDLQHSEILATADGVAVNLGVHTEGAVVRQGETLLEIVPKAPPWKSKGTCRST
jgi:protease secretion system membrane fusion protein